MQSWADFSDPQHTQTDAELISVLQRVWLLPKDNHSIALTNENKFNLDTIVGDGGLFRHILHFFGQ